MNKIEIRRAIKEALIRENGYAPASRQIEGLRIVYTFSGIRGWFRVGGCEYIFKDGEVTKIARSNTRTETKKADRE